MMMTTTTTTTIAAQGRLKIPRLAHAYVGPSGGLTPERRLASRARRELQCELEDERKRRSASPLTFCPAPHVSSRSIVRRRLADSSSLPMSVSRLTAIELPAASTSVPAPHPPRAAPGARSRPRISTTSSKAAVGSSPARAAITWPPRFPSSPSAGSRPRISCTLAVEREDKVHSFVFL
jgi:hypothetical protein